LLKKYIKQKNMRLLLTFIIFILGGFYTFGKENCCEQCCEYLGIFCNKGKEEEEKKEKNKEEEEKEGEENNGKGKKEEDKNEEEKELEKFCLKKNEKANLEEIKKLISTDWYDNKGEEASFILYEKIDDAENQNINKKDVIKIKKDKNGFSIDENFITEKDNNTQKWALFEIIYKEEKEDKEKETKYLYCSDIESGQYYGIFSSCKQHISISVIACNTSNVTNMRSMFYICSSLTELDLSNFNTETVTDMGSMFCDCSSLQTLDLSKFNTDIVTDMSGMFFNCSRLTKLDLSKFNTDNVTDTNAMFYDCKSLTELDLPKFDTKKVIEMTNMFSGCSSLHTVTFNKNLNEKIKNLLNELGFTEKIKEEGNKITLKKNN